MDTKKELEKINTILSGGKFMYRGVAFTLDADATKKHPLNANLHGKPLMKLVGVDSNGAVVTAWSHDCVIGEPLPEAVLQGSIESPDFGDEPDIVPETVKQVLKQRHEPKRKKKVSHG
jgi:hypothetical protein